jgi:hypothetical protein
MQLFGSQRVIASLTALVALGVTAAAAESGRGTAKTTAASRSQIAIHEQGEHNITDESMPIVGAFTIELAGAPFGPKGTTRISPSPGATTELNGQTRLAVTGMDTLTSAKGRIVLAITGIHIDVNGKLTPSGFLVGPAVEYGTWKIKSASGIYRGWKGGGVWVSATYGYVQPEPYSVEWDGYITR